MVINPIVGVYIPIIRIAIKGGMTIPNTRSLDPGSFEEYARQIGSFPHAGAGVKEYLKPPPRDVMAWLGISSTSSTGHLMMDQHCRFVIFEDPPKFTTHAVISSYQ